MNQRRLTHLDVFTGTPLLGNPLAVIHDAQGLDDDRMAALARWTNLSETTFLLPPTDPAADYRVRIFTPEGELPFAGHPTLGSCCAWLAAGGSARNEHELVQQCEIGLVRVRRVVNRLAFAAPPLRRSGPVDAALRAQVLAALGDTASAVRDIQWIDNGPPWIGVLLQDAQAVLALQPQLQPVPDMKLGVVGPWAPGGECAFEVRAFTRGGVEDPVTGSLNAGLARWLMEAGVAPSSYVASQGTAMQRRGRVYVERVDADIWIGGDVCVVASGTIAI